MDSIDNKMNIKTPRADVNQSSSQAGQVSKTSSQGSSQAQAAPKVSGDTVTFTNQAAEMLKLEEVLASIPDVDSNNVNEIKASIADGSYHIDPEKIVNNLLSFERDLP